MKNLANQRIYSIDVFRAVTMFLMVFVNDVAGVKDIPSWLGHTQAEEDGMGFSDVIFPAFLFIVGLSLPIALQHKIAIGRSFTSISGYIVLRSAALIIMGFFHVNFGGYNPDAPIAYPVYVLMVTASFFLIWNDYGKRMRNWLRYLLMVTGIFLLGTLAYLYEGRTHGMQPSWWGILGIIGWAYLVAAFVYLLFGKKIKWLTIATCLFFLINILTHGKYIDWKLPVIGDASSISLIMGGVLVSVFYTKLSKSLSALAPFMWMSIAGTFFIVLGFILRPYTGGISKIYATPAWVFICMGISMIMFGMFTWLIDKKKKENWFTIIKSAGTSTLTCYLIPYMIYACFKLVKFQYPLMFTHGGGGILRSLFFALIVVLICRGFEKLSIKLKV